MTTFYQLTSYLENLQALISLKENEKLSEDLLLELENESNPEIKNKEQYIELNNTMRDIENQLTTIINMLCIMTSKIGNIITKLNYIDTSVILK